MSITEAVHTLEQEKRSVSTRLNAVTLAIEALSPDSKPPKRHMSPAARRRISLAQKERWQRWHRKHK